MKTKRVNAHHPIDCLYKNGRMLEFGSILEAAHLVSCCKKMCIRKFDYDEVTHISHDIWLYNGLERVTFILTKLNNLLRNLECTSKGEVMLMVKG